MVMRKGGGGGKKIDVLVFVSPALTVHTFQPPNHLPGLHWWEEVSLVKRPSLHPQRLQPSAPTCTGD